MADSQVKTANICNITSSTELRGNGGGTGTFLTNNSIEVYCDGSAYWSGVFFISGSESLIVGEKYTISFTPYCTNNNAIRVQFCGVADNYTFTSGVRKTITVTAVDTFRTVAFYAGDAVEKTITIKDIQIEKGETATVYRPYSATGWLHSLRKLGTATEAVENPLHSDGTAITAYTLKGNEEHTGTPSPQNPVDVNGVGVRTENLFDKDKQAGNIYVTESIQRYGVEIPVEAGIYTIVGGTTKVFVKGKYGTTYDTAIDTSVRRNITLPQNGYILIYAGKAEDYDVSNIMLNTGSTAKPFEPYGYKIPISSNGVSLTPMYFSQQLFKIGDITDNYVSIGTVTYNSSKYELTGGEDWQKSASINGWFYVLNLLRIRPDSEALCTDYVYYPPSYSQSATLPNGGFAYDELKYGAYTAIAIVNTDYNNVNDFKQYLATRYAAGNPVTIYYIKQTPTTETVTAPTIPTTEGANTITVDTTVQPSEFTATWTGWHDAEVKERTENLTTVYSPNTSSSSGLNFEAIGDKLRIYGAASTYVQCINTNDIILPSGTYTFSISSSIGNTGFYAQFRSVDGTTTYATITNTTTITFNEATTGRIRVIISATESNPYATDEVISIMINEGSTALPYEPYWK